MQKKLSQNHQKDVLLIFDLDGCLVKTRDLHYEALNLALSHYCGYKIDYKDHLCNFDGLSTTKKLDLLRSRGLIKREDYNDIWEAKQKHTYDLLPSVPIEHLVVEAIEELSKKHKIVVCSNAVRKTINCLLYHQGTSQYIEKVYSNQDVFRPKPNPEIYLRVMADLGYSPNNTLIIEDSHIGRTSAISSCANVMEVSGPEEVTLDNINRKINSIENKVMRPKWKGKINVVIPAAGLGSRFEKAGYSMPKPLIDVHRKPMICKVIENLNIDGQYTFIIQREHTEKYNLKQMLEVVCPGCNVVELDGLTEGAACTVLAAKEFIDNDTPLLVANSDQFVSNWDSNEFLYSSQQVDGSILCFNSTHPKWSYAKTDEDGFLTEIKEKQVISNNATVGIYYWNKGSYLVKSIEDMIEADDRFNGEFYLAPSYNYMVDNNMNVKISTVDEEDVWGLGTPEDLKYFTDNHK